MIGSPGLWIDALEELLQRGHQHRGLALPEQVHEHHLLLQGQVQQTQTVQHGRLQVLLACRGGGGEAERGVRTKGPCLTDTGLRNIRALTREGRVGVQLADALIQQAEAERQRGRVVEQVEHDAVSGGLVSCDLLALKFQHLLDKVGRLGLVVPQQFVEYFQDSVCNFPLGQHNFFYGGEKK